MKFTLSWLKRHLDTEANAQEIAEKLTSIGLEIEEVINKGKIYEPFVIAEVEAAVPHLNAEKLKLCTVNNGKEKLQVVCGAANARAGIKVVLAPIGAVIPVNGMQIKASKIRGVESQGMLCSAAELLLGEDGEGIIELPGGAPVGKKFAEFANLNEVVIDIALTPNRGDATSVYGIARDLAATKIGKLKKANAKVEIGNFESKIKITIEDKEGCQEFLGRYVEAVKNLPSTGEISDFMRAIGSTSKTQLVDISNFAMFEYGRPSHFYDADKIDGSIIVRKAKKEEQFIALGGQEYLLDEEVMVIADNTKVLAVAGVIGGELSKVDEHTKNIFIEVANFNPIVITQVGRKLNVNTDSRYRFERRVDSANSEFFMHYLSQLVAKECGGNFSQVIIARGNMQSYLSEIEFSSEKLAELAGFKIDVVECKRILESLEFEFTGNKVRIPSFRQGDVIGEVDLIEEVLRIYGYDKIPSIPLKIDSEEFKNLEVERSAKIRNRLVSRGLDEAITWSFMEKEVAKIFGFSDLIKLHNPISLELSVMRPTIVSNLLSMALKNISRGYNDFGLFEIGAIYNHSYPEKQTECISGIRVGNILAKSVHKEERKVDFYDGKADIFAALEDVGFNPENLIASKGTPQYYHPGRSAAFKLGNKEIAYAGEIHPVILKKLGIEEAIVGFELFIENLPSPKVKNAKSKLEVSDFQSVVRDFAFIVNQELEAQVLLKSIKALNKDLIEQVSIFDVYSGKGIEEGKKSVAISIKLQPKDRTLSDVEIEEISANVINQTSLKFGAKLR